MQPRPWPGFCEGRQTLHGESGVPGGARPVLKKGRQASRGRNAPVRDQPRPRQTRHPFAAWLIPRVPARCCAPCRRQSRPDSRRPATACTVLGPLRVVGVPATLVYALMDWLRDVIARGSKVVSVTPRLRIFWNESPSITFPQIPMNHQGVSEIFFEETYSVPPEQTARALFARLPHGSDYAERLIECLATGYLVAVVESICIREMQRYVDAAAEVVVGRTVQIEHKAPIPPGSSLKLRGWVERLGERSATFCVQASDEHEFVCESSITLVAAQRAAMESRIAAKVGALVASPTGEIQIRKIKRRYFLNAA